MFNDVHMKLSAQGHTIYSQIKNYSKQIRQMAENLGIIL